MDVDPPTSDPRAHLTAAAADARTAKEALDRAILTAANAGLAPSEIESLTGYSREGTRKALRRVGVGPARQGRHPASASKASASST